MSLGTEDPSSEIVSYERNAALVDDMIDEMEYKAITEAIEVDLAKTRKGVSHWVNQLDLRLQKLQECISSTSTAGANERSMLEKEVCEATRMLLAFGRFHHVITTMIMADGSPRPEEAWDVPTAQRACVIFGIASDAIKEDARRGRVAERARSFTEEIGTWCPELPA